MATEAQLLQALKAADAAGNAEDATKLARMLKSRRTSFGSNMVRAVSTGLANLAGAPVELANAAISPVVRAFGGTPSDEPIGGMKSMRRAMNVYGDVVNAPLELAGLEREAPQTYESLEELPAGHRPFAAAAETFAGGVGGGAVITSTLRGAAQVPRALRPIQEAVRARPGAVMAGEVATSAGAGQGAFIAEAVAPGDPLARAGAEIAGGFVSPSSLVSRGVSLLRRAGSSETAEKVIPAFTKSGSQKRAAEIVQRVVKESGEDPEALARILEEADPNNLVLTSAQKTGSQALLNLEAKLGLDRPQAAGGIEAVKDTALAAMRETAEALAASGDPRALRTAATLRQRYFANVLGARLTQATREANAAQEAIVQRGGGRAAQTEASTRAYQALDDALTDTNRIERELWGRIPRNVPIGSRGLSAANERALSEILPNEDLPEPIAGYLADLAQRNMQPTVGEFLTLRTRALTLAREARAKGNWTDNRYLSMIADGVLDDLNALNLPEAVPAREFTRAKHDAFTRTFAGKALADASSGAERIPPELLLERAFGSGGTGGALRFGEIREAAGFPPGASRAGEAASAQEDFLRAQASRLADPQTGAIPPARAQRFLNENAQALAQFPALRDELRRTVSTSQRAESVAATVATRLTRAESTLGRVLNIEDPVAAVGRVLAGRNPTREYLGLARMARRGGPQAVEGMRAATLRDAIGKATKDETLSFTDLNRRLTDGGTLDLMRRSGTIGADDVVRLRQLMTRASRLEQAAGDSRAIQNLVGTPDAMFDLVVRVLGARAGSLLHSAGPAGGGPGTIIAAARGSQTARNIFEKIPLARVGDVLIEAVKEPKFMAALLRKTTTRQARVAVERQINAFLIQAGIVGPARELQESQ